MRSVSETVHVTLFFHFSSDLYVEIYVKEGIIYFFDRSQLSV